MFFFKQKTAYELRISDWSSDVCSSDLITLTALFSLVGFWNARRLARVVDIELPIAGLPAALSGFIIVQLSDIHVGPTIKRGYLDAIVRRVNGLDADLIALTGDIVDGHIDRLRRHEIGRAHV